MRKLMQTYSFQLCICYCIESIFNTDGSFLHCFGSTGNGQGEFNKPYAIAKDMEGKFLYISDLMNDRVVVC